jgi:hypothetical protein
MSQAIEPLHEGLFPGFREFAERVWDRPRADAYYRWRYAEAPGLLTLVAHRDGRCLAAISAFRRPYRLGGRTVECLETFDWACLPELRGSGLGVRVIRKLMDMGPPIVSLGGTRDTLALLPRLGFQHVATGHRYVRPFSGAAIRSDAPGASGRSAFVAAALDVAAPLLFRRSARAPGARALLVPLSSLDGFAYELDEPPGFRGLPHRPHIEWLTRGLPAAGWFLPFGFAEQGRILGWALARVYQKNHALFGILLDLRYSDAGAAHLGRIVRAIVGTLCGMGVESIWTATTCPRLGAALRRNRFLRRAPLPALVWPGVQEIADEPVRLSLLRADDGLVPLPTASEYATLYSSGRVQER